MVSAVVAEARTASLPRHGTPSGRVPEIDGLRGLAVLSVLFYHFTVFGVTGTASWLRSYKLVAGMGWAGVDLFFVLSGYLITRILVHSVAKPDYYRKFYFRRTVRIFPLYYASLVLFYLAGPVLLALVHKSASVDELIRPSSQAFAWLYILNWRMGLVSYAVVPEFLHHFWSLSIEEQFYLVWPTVVRFLKPRRLLVACLGMAAVSLILRIGFHSIGMGNAAYVLTFCRLDSLAIGAAIAICSLEWSYWRVARSVAPWAVGVSAAAVVAIVAFARSASFHGTWMGTAGVSCWAFFFGGLLVLTLSAPESGVWFAITASRPLQFFGKYSYGLYVCHQPLIVGMSLAGFTSARLAGKLGSDLLAVIAVNATALAIAILIALASWHLFEKHFLKLKERFGRGGAI